MKKRASARKAKAKTKPKVKPKTKAKVRTRRTKSATSADRPVVGWREWVVLPDLDVARIKAKIDTGARSSAIHAFDVHVYWRAGRERVRFKIHPIQRSTRETILADCAVVGHRRVRSSSGHAEIRPVIRTRVTVLDVSYPIELTLAKRDTMGFRMLLGRADVRDTFLVHPGRSFLGGRRRKRRRKVRRGEKAAGEAAGKRAPRPAGKRT